MACQVAECLGANKCVLGGYLDPRVPSPPGEKFQASKHYLNKCDNGLVKAIASLVLAFQWFGIKL